MIYIYALVRNSLSNEVRYIGKTVNKNGRLAAHIAKAKSGQTKHHCSNWINSLLASGFRPEMVVIKELPDDAEWQIEEAAIIAEHLAAGHQLTNSTGGGDGFHHVPPDILKKRGKSLSVYLLSHEGNAKLVARSKEAQSRLDVRQKHKDAAEAAWGDSNVRAKLLASMRTPEAIRKRSHAAIKRQADPELAAAHVARMRAIKDTPEGREQLRLAREKGWSDPIVASNHIDAIKRAHAKPEVKARVIAINSDINSRLEVRAAKSAAAKANWAKRGFVDKMKAAHAAAGDSERQRKAVTAMWADPAMANKISDARWTPEHRKAQGEKCKDPARRAKISASLKVSHAARKSAGKQFYQSLLDK